MIRNHTFAVSSILSINVFSLYYIEIIYFNQPIKRRKYKVRNGCRSNNKVEISLGSKGHKRIYEINFLQISGKMTVVILVLIVARLSLKKTIQQHVTINVYECDQQYPWEQVFFVDKYKIFVPKHFFS